MQAQSVPKAAFSQRFRICTVCWLRAHAASPAWGACAEMEQEHEMLLGKLVVGSELLQLPLQPGHLPCSPLCSLGKRELLGGPRRLTCSGCLHLPASRELSRLLVRCQRSEGCTQQLCRKAEAPSSGSEGLLLLTAQQGCHRHTPWWMLRNLSWHLRRYNQYLCRTQGFLLGWHVTTELLFLKRTVHLQTDSGDKEKCHQTS